VRVSYCVPDAIFKIPDGLDLEDKSVVADWGVKYGVLHIKYVDGRKEKIGWSIDPSDFDYKWAEDMAIENADDCCVEYSEDEEEGAEHKGCCGNVD